MTYILNVIPVKPHRNKQQMDSYYQLISTINANISQIRGNTLRELPNNRDRSS